MNDDQQNRLEIMKALEKEFPDRVLEDLIEVARYVEAGGIERARQESQDSAAKFLEEVIDTPAPRTWWKLDDIPDYVGAVTDADGHVIRRAVWGDRLVWKLEDAARYKNVVVTDNLAPFTEVCND